MRTGDERHTAGAAEEKALEADELGLLERLQSVADDIDRLEARRQEAQKEKNRVEDNLRQAEAALAEKEKRVYDLDIERRKRELTIKAEKERMQRVKARLGEVKTSREYQAVLTETSLAKQNITTQEETLLKEMEQLDIDGAEIDELKAKVRGISEDLAEAAAGFDATVGETEQGISDRKSQEEALLQALPTEIVDRYRLIRARRGGLAVVEARDEACTACFMRIPPQMYNEVIRRSKVIQCPNCLRILIPPRTKPEE